MEDKYGADAGDDNLDKIVDMMDSIDTDWSIMGNTQSVYFDG